MKFAITGHSSGIGKAVYDRLYPDVLGFSRSNGYDITDPASRRKIVKESIECDVFINNAHNGFSQIDMLVDLFTEWRDLPKVIINIGSRAADKSLTQKNQHLLHYMVQKRSLKSIIPLLVSHTCRVEYRSFGYVGTPRILAKYPNFTPDKYIEISEAVDIILSGVM
jgi:hypothetical protein